MIRYFFTSLLFLCFMSTVKAVDIPVSETFVKFDHGKHNALQVAISGVQEKNVIKAWAKKMKDLKGVVKQGRHEVEAMGAIYYDIHHYPGNFYAKSKENDGVVIFSVAVDLEGKYIESSDNKQGYEALKQFLIKFSKEAIRAQVENDLNEAEKALKKQQKELAKLKRKKVKLKEHIIGWKQDIKQAESDTIQNNLNQKKQVDLIQNQEHEIENIKKKQAEI